MYEEKLWLDHVTEFEDRYREQTNADGTIIHIPVEGEVLQQGTPQNAQNFNHMETGISEAHALAGLLVISAIHQGQKLDDLAGETIQVTVNNSESYPLNNSQKTIALGTNRNNLNYTVQPEIVSASGGFVNGVEITDKLVNGFKVKFTGSATQVVLKLFVKGGFYSG